MGTAQRTISWSSARTRRVASSSRRIRISAGHLLAGSPRQLLIVATGNITNNTLLSLFELHLGAIVSSFEEADFVELSHNALALGGRAARDDS
jgi:predicted nuclease of predicted toxin-antitoxin system